MLVFSLKLLELKATQKTFTLETTVKLGSVTLTHHRPHYDMLNIIDTPTTFDEANEYLFIVTYMNVSLDFCKENQIIP